MLVWVCGSRGLDPPMEVLVDVLRRLGCSRVLHGGARGVDYAAGVAGAQLGVPVGVIVADWDGLGKRAGHVRNGLCARRALDERGVCLAVYAELTPGTADSVRQAKALGVPVHTLTLELSGAWRRRAPDTADGAPDRNGERPQRGDQWMAGNVWMSSLFT